MKTILSALVALSVVAGVAGTANALDAKISLSRSTAITTNALMRCPGGPRGCLRPPCFCAPPGETMG